MLTLSERRKKSQDSEDQMNPHSISLLRTKTHFESFQHMRTAHHHVMSNHPDTSICSNSMELVDEVEMGSVRSGNLGDGATNSGSHLSKSNLSFGSNFIDECV